MENSEFCMRQFAWEVLGVAVSDMKTFMTCLTLGIMIDPFLLCDSLTLISFKMMLVMKEKDAEEKLGWQR